MNSSQEPKKLNSANIRALRFVVRMGLTMLTTAAFCWLIWWLSGNRSYDTLGQMIMSGGGIFILFGVLSLSPRGHRAILDKYYSTVSKNPRRLEIQSRKFLGDWGNDTRIILFFFGIGLLFLFIGNLIVLGL